MFMETGSSQNLNMYISKQVCQKLNGDMKLEVAPVSISVTQQVFKFFVRCMHAEQMLGTDSLNRSMIQKKRKESSKNAT